jgi:O-antigen/teichoic acid export membrane protein
MSTAKTLAKGTAWGVLGTFFIKFIGWLYYVYLARAATTEEVGLFFLALSVISVILIFSDLGLGPGAVGRYVPFYVGRGEYNNVRQVIRIALAAGMAFSLICALAIYFFAGNISEIFINPGLISPLQILAIYVFVYNFYQASYAFLVGRKLIKLSSYVSSIQALGKLILTVLFILYFGASAKNIALGYTLSFAVAAVYGMRWLAKEYKNFPKTGEKPIENKPLFKEMIVFGMTTLFLASMSTINSYFDRIMMGFLLPAATSASLIGIYSISISLTTVIMFFIYPLGNIFSSMLTEAIGRRDESQVEGMTATYTRWMSITTAPIMLMLLLFPTEILKVIYGVGYESGAMALILYSIGLFIYTFSYSIQSVLTAMKRLDVIAKVITLGSIVNVVLNLLFIPAYGMEGAAFTSALSFIIMTALFMRTDKSMHLGVRLDIFKPLLAGALTAVPLLCIKYLAGGFIYEVISSHRAGMIENISVKTSGFLLMGLLFGIIAVFYLVFIIILRAYTKEDVEVVSSGMRRAKIPVEIIKRVNKVLEYP